MDNLDLKDKLENLLYCYEEYANLLATGDAGEKYRGNIINILNEQFEKALQNKG